MPDEYMPLQDRIDCCRILISELNADIQLYFEQEIDVQTPPGDSEDTHHVVVIQKQGMPAIISVKVGLIAHELRSCLDALACAQAVLNGKSADYVYFPISKSLESFEDDGQKKIRKLSDADKDIIASLAPYKCGHPLLFGLHETDRLRKHRGLIRAKCRNNSVQARIGSGHSIQAQGNSTIIIDKVTRPDGEIDRNVSVHSGVSFEEVGVGYEVSSNVSYGAPIELAYSVCYNAPEEIKGRDVVGFLKEAADTVESIIRMF